VFLCVNTLPVGQKKMGCAQPISSVRTDVLLARNCIKFRRLFEVAAFRRGSRPFLGRLNSPFPRKSTEIAMADPLPIAIHGDLTLDLLPALANRHGLITGATGTGKTVTLQVMAERLSSIGVPIFMADVKGDLAGLS